MEMTLRMEMRLDQEEPKKGSVLGRIKDMTVEELLREIDLTLLDLYYGRLADCGDPSCASGPRCR